MKSKLKKSQTSLVALISSKSSSIELDDTEYLCSSSGTSSGGRDDMEILTNRLNVVTIMANSSPAPLNAANCSSSGSGGSSMSNACLLLNRTSSNSSCNSDSDYNSVNSSASLSASCSPSPQPSIVVKPSLHRPTGILNYIIIQHLTMLKRKKKIYCIRYHIY